MTLPKSIGIKLYDDSFVPVLTEGETKNKRVILTTGKDNQKKAVIEIYEGTSAKCSENEYLGKLSIKLDRATNKGEPAFEVNLRLDDNGVLYAKAWDQDSKEESELVIENMASNRITQENMTDEEISNYEDTQVQELPVEETEKYEDHHVDSLQYENTSYKNANIYNDDDDSRKKRIILGVIIAVLLIAIIILIILCCKSCSSNESISAVRQKSVSTQITEPSVSTPVDVKEPKESDDVTILQETKGQTEIETEEPPEREITPPEPEAEPEVVVKKEEPAGMNVLEGQKHYVRYGDNLWNICKRYYGDPWYYPDLAKQNNIAVPRRIYAGQYIIIPQKSKVQRWDFSN